MYFLYIAELISKFFARPITLFLITLIFKYAVNSKLLYIFLSHEIYFGRCQTTYNSRNIIDNLWPRPYNKL